MPLRKTTVLVADDDVRMLRMMQRILELEGYQVLTASNGRDALAIFESEATDLLLLDIMMPFVDGYAICRRIREYSQIPIIMVTARGSDDEKVEGLDAGADDYMSKPFSAKELAARVRAVLRRAGAWDEHPVPAFRFRDLVIDFVAHRVSLGGQDVNLTATEYGMLSYLAANAGRVLTPDQLLEKVWGEDYIGEDHILQVNMARLRQKLKDDARNPVYVLTRPGIGYMMQKEHKKSL
ncbi:MAG: response regulator transcription factor [Candidatus Aenigmatarchaeota archaeon]